MDDKQNKVLSNQGRDDVYRIYETSMARMDRQLRRLWIAILVAVIATVATNIAWLIYISQYDFESCDYSQDGTGVNIIGDSNGVSYNGAEAENKEKDIEESFTS